MPGQDLQQCRAPVEANVALIRKRIPGSLGIDPGPPGRFWELCSQGLKRREL